MHRKQPENVSNRMLMSFLSILLLFPCHFADVPPREGLKTVFPLSAALGRTRDFELLLAEFFFTE